MKESDVKKRASLAESKRVQKLRSEIARLRGAYHTKDSPVVADDVYDSLNRELKSLIEKYPEFDDLNAPENRVGGEPLDKFEKVKHEIKMFSIGNVFSDEETLPIENIFISCFTFSNLSNGSPPTLFSGAFKSSNSGYFSIRDLSSLLSESYTSSATTAESFV